MWIDMTAATAGKEIEEIETYVMKAAEKTGYFPLKPEQKTCLMEFLLGKDVCYPANRIRQNHVLCLFASGI